MYRILALVVLISVILIYLFILTPPGNCSDLNSCHLQMIKSSKVIKAELVKIQKELSRLSSREKGALKSTHIGDESMTEMDVLVLGEDMIESGLEKYEFYLKHSKRPLKTDAGGNYREIIKTPDR